MPKLQQVIQVFGEQISLVELTGALFGIAGIWLTMKANILCFPAGLVNVIVSLVLFFQQKLYSDVIQQFVYIILLSYGWNKWISGDLKSNRLHVSTSSFQLWLFLFLICILFTLVVGTVFEKYTDASLPYLDAAATAISFIAQWMIAKKKIENWILWIIVDLGYVGIYVYKGLFMYAFLFAVYFLLAIKGWIEWKKNLKINKENPDHAG